MSAALGVPVESITVSLDVDSGEVTYTITSSSYDEAVAIVEDLENPAVAAIKKQTKNNNRGGGNSQFRGQNRGQRGGGRGGQNRGGGGNNRGARQPQGPRHPQALEGSCYVHHQYGPEAWSCADRHKCPMRDIESPKPKHNRNIPIEK